MKNQPRGKNPSGSSGESSIKELVNRILDDPKRNERLKRDYQNYLNRKKDNYAK